MGEDNITGQTVEPTKDTKTAVVYFLATGTTEKIANYIASATGGNLFEIDPKKTYTGSFFD